MLTSPLHHVLGHAQDASCPLLPSEGPLRVKLKPVFGRGGGH